MSKSLKRHFVLMEGAAGDGGAAGGGGGGGAGAGAAAATGAGAAALAGAGGDAAAAAAAAAATAAAGGAGGGAAAPDWTAGIQNTELKAWVTNKGFKDASQVAESALNLEKLIGLDRAGRTIVIPKADAPEAEHAAYREKLGVPTKADDYGLAKVEGMDPNAAKVAEAWMHKAGIPKAAAEMLAKEQIAHTKAAQIAAGEAFVTQSNADMTALKTEWGQAFLEKSEAARRGAMEFLPEKTTVNVNGVPTEVGRAELMNHMERFLGTKGFMTFMQNIGSKVGEHKGVEPGSQGGQGGALTPAEATKKIAQLRADPVWSKKYLEGGKNSAEFAEMTRLQKMVNPPEEGGAAPGL